MKKIISWIKDLKVWQKVIFGILLIGIIALVIGSLVLLSFKINSSIEKGKLENYLTEVGYNCQDDYCTRNKENKLEEVWLESSFYDTKAMVEYSVKVEDNYRVTIRRRMYQKVENVDGALIFAYGLGQGSDETLYVPEDYYKANFENQTYGEFINQFIDSGTYWHKGDKAVLVRAKKTATGLDTIETDLSNYVNEALREYESYFEEANVDIN